MKAMVTGRDRRPDLGIKLALECRRNIIYPVKVAACQPGDIIMSSV